MTYLLPGKIFQLLSRENPQWVAYAVSILLYILGFLTFQFLFPETVGLSVSLVFLPFVVWFGGSLVAGKPLADYHPLSWLTILLIVAFCVVLPVVFLFEFNRLLDPKLAGFWYLVLVVFMCWLIYKVAKDVFGLNWRSETRSINAFRLNQLFASFFASGMVLALFGVPLALFRWLRSSMTLWFLAPWFLVFLIFSMVVTYQWARLSFDIAPVTSLVLSLWPVGSMGYLLLYPLRDFTPQPYSLFGGLNFPPESLYLPVPFLVLVSLLFACLLVGYWIGNQRHSAVVRASVSSVIGSGVLVLLFAFIVLVGGRLVLTPPELKTPEWEFETDASAEEHYRSMNEFNKSLDLGNVDLSDEYDTDSLLNQVGDTLSKGRKIYGRSMKIPTDHYRSGTVPQVLGAIKLFKLYKIKAIEQIKSGDFSEGLNTTRFITEASHNLLEARSQLITNLVAQAIFNQAIPPARRLTQEPLGRSQRRKLHDMLLDMADWPIPLSEIFLVETFHLKRNKRRWDRFWEELYQKRSSAEFQYLFIQGLSSVDRIRQYLIDRQYRFSAEVEIPYYRLNPHNKDGSQFGFLSVILRSPHYPVASFLWQEYTRSLKETSKEWHKPLRRTRRLLHKNSQKFQSDPPHIPKSFRRDPMTGELIEESG